MSSRRGSRDIDELIRQKTLLGSKASKKDKRYGEYAGADFATGRLLGRIDLVLDRHWFPELEEGEFNLKDARAILDADRISGFMSMADVLTQLSAIIGEDRVIGDASKRNIPIRIDT